MEYAEQLFSYDGFDCPACRSQAAANKSNPPCRRDDHRCFMEGRVNIDPGNVLAWNFFWSMEANGWEFALSHYHPQFATGYERDLFHEKLFHLKNQITHLRNEKMKKEINKQ